MSASPLRIVELRADSVKRLRAVTIRPNEDGSMVVLAGANGAGKSSVLDAIAMALGGKEQIPAEPVRRGEERGEVVLDLGEIVVRRTFTAAGGSSLVVSNAEGARFSSPQSMLDKLIGRLSFDPIEFAREKPKRQAEILSELLGIDLVGLDWNRESAFKERTDVNRKAKSLQARLDAMPKHEDVPEAEVDVAQLVEQVGEIRARNEERLRVQHQWGAAENAVAAAREKVKALRAELEQAEAQLEQREQESRKLAQQVTDDVEDVGPLLEQVRGAEDTNRKVRENAERAKLAAEHAKVTAEAQALTDRIEKFDQERRATIAAAAMPVDGLGFDEKGNVTLNDLPLEQASAAERLRVSVAIGIAMNPRLRVLLIRDAALLDHDSLRMVAEMAQSADCQLWVERIDKDSMTTVVIEDGQVQEEAAAAAMEA